MSEGRLVSNLNQHESIYGTIMEEPGNLHQIAKTRYNTEGWLEREGDSSNSYLDSVMRNLQYYIQSKASSSEPIRDLTQPTLKDSPQPEPK